MNTDELSAAGPGLGLTLALLATGAIVFAFAAWRHGRPHDPAKGARMVPWVLVLLVAATWCVVMIVHIVNLYGIETGRGRPF